MHRLVLAPPGVMPLHDSGIPAETDAWLGTPAQPPSAPEKWCQHLGWSPELGY